MMLYPETQNAAQLQLDQSLCHNTLPEMADIESLPYIVAMAKELLRYAGVINYIPGSADAIFILDGVLLSH